jgi:hypothetical protein
MFDGAPLFWIELVEVKSGHRGANANHLDDGTR